ncbi:MAG: FAD-binding oxidoreductase [Gemmatimonadales bacterium]|nr:MAG: FAD-binding oxidoreductase [Gemmatimonadales bacterium]
MSPSITRRNFLRTGTLAGASLLLGGCGLRGAPSAPSPVRRVRPLAPVHVRRDRVIRTVAGIRPYRPAGFVVRAAQFGDRTVIHNYGHGGGGISLAWGSSELAVELAGEAAAEREIQDFAVLGCGIMGLTTARLLQDRGYRVTIYARDLPPHTTSNVGGGQWSPFTVFQTGETSPAFDLQYERAARLSHGRYQTMVGPRYGVRWIENYILRDQPSPGRTGPISDLFYQVEEFGPGEHPFASPWVGRQSTMLIEPNTFLPAVTEDFLLRGGRIVPRTFDSTAEILALEEEGIVNCTGIGSRSLFGDFDLVPIKGQLAILLPQPEVDYIALGGGSYMFPRTDGIVLGGSQERGEWSTTTTPEVQDRILEGNRSIFEGMALPGQTGGIGEMG